MKKCAGCKGQLVTEPELQQYLDDHKATFEIPTQRRYTYVAYTHAEAEQGVTATATHATTNDTSTFSACAASMLAFTTSTLALDMVRSIARGSSSLLVRSGSGAYSDSPAASRASCLVGNP